jgi:hypothetical protein
MARSPVDYLGLDYLRNHDHLRRWWDAMNKGRRTLPPCTATTGAGSPCGQLTMREGRALGVHLCRHHARGVIRDKIDAAREIRALRWSVSGNVRNREVGLSALTTIFRRRAWLALRADPVADIRILLLSSADEARVSRWLREHGISHDTALPDTGHPLTRYAMERLRYAAVMALSGRLTQEAARRRIISAVRWDAEYWRKKCDQVSNARAEIHNDPTQ